MSRKISVISNQLEALQHNFKELDELTSLDNPSTQQKNRMSYLYSVQATLRQGVSEHTINRALLYKLKRELGMHEEDNIDQLRVQNPTMLSEWRNLVHNEGRLFKADEEYRDVDTGGNA